jgi:hypothetical protein
MNKKAVGSLFFILGSVLILVVIYLILLIPIPLFTSIRTQVNYWLILIFWVLLQVGLIVGYYKVGTYALKGINMIKNNVVKWSLGIRDYIIVHS